MQLVGYLYKDYHNARSLEHKALGVSVENERGRICLFCSSRTGRFSWSVGDRKVTLLNVLEMVSCLHHQGVMFWVTSVFCVHLHNCCHSQPTVHIQGATVYVNTTAVLFIMTEADSPRNIRYHLCFPVAVHLKRLRDVYFSLISQSVAKSSITCSVEL